MRKKILLAIAASVAMVIGAAGSAQALACSRWAFTGFDGRTYYFYGPDSISGSLATAATTVGGTPCLLYTKSVATSIRLPNGSHAYSSSLLGQCAASISISRGSYDAFQIKSTHTLNLWNGATWTYVD